MAQSNEVTCHAAIPRDSTRRSGSRWLQRYRVLAPYARRHRRLFVQGVLASLMVVGMRLALPWPLRAVMKPYLRGELNPASHAIAWIPEWINPVVAMGVIFVLVMVALGFFDLIERLYFARFTIGTVRDLRADVFRAAVRSEPQDQGKGSGDLVARLIGDTARLKTALKGFLVHVATNGATFAGVIVVLLWINVPLGLIFALSALVMGVITAMGSSRMCSLAAKYRRKEGELADIIEMGLRDDLEQDPKFGRLNRTSGQFEASLTRVQGITTWCAYGLIGIALMMAMWLGTYEVARGKLVPGDVLVVMMYALMLRGPIVKLARQGARTGKVIACFDRLERVLCSSGGGPRADYLLSPLQNRLELAGVRMVSRARSSRRRVLGPIDLVIPAGQHLAVVGPSGSGKSAFVELLAGAQPARHGAVLWDGTDLSVYSARSRSPLVAYLPQSSTWLPRRAYEFLNLPAAALDEETREILSVCGAEKAVRRFPGGLEGVMGSEDLSSGERRALALARLLLIGGSLWLLDDPFVAMKKTKARKLLHYVLESTTQATVVVTMGRPVDLFCFDRIIKLQRGRVVFDGPPSAWEESVNTRDQEDERTATQAATPTTHEEGGTQ